MRAFQRLKHTVSVSIESLLDQIENQEAVANATIRQLERGAVRVRVHGKRCERRISELERRAHEMDCAVRLWRERARRLRDERDKALECVRRCRTAEHARSLVHSELEKERQLLDKIREDEQTLGAKLDELRRRCAALSSREARSAAHGGGEGVDDIEAIFDRWEARVEEREAAYGSGSSVDDGFERSLSREETEGELERALDDILAEEEARS